METARRAAFSCEGLCGIARVCANLSGNIGIAPSPGALGGPCERIKDRASQFLHVPGPKSRARSPLKRVEATLMRISQFQRRFVAQCGRVLLEQRRRRPAGGTGKVMSGRKAIVNVRNCRKHADSTTLADCERVSGAEEHFFSIGLGPTFHSGCAWSPTGPPVEGQTGAPPELFAASRKRDETLKTRFSELMSDAIVLCAHCAAHLSRLERCACSGVFWGPAVGLEIASPKNRSQFFFKMFRKRGKRLHCAELFPKRPLFVFCRRRFLVNWRPASGHPPLGDAGR